MFGNCTYEKERIKFVGYLISRLLFQCTSRYREDPYTPMWTDTHTRARTHTRGRARTIRHACTHREAYGRCIVIRRNDCTSWCTSLCNRCASLSAITCVSTTVKARMCTGCNSIYLPAHGTYVRCVNGVSFRQIFLFFSHVLETSCRNLSQLSSRCDLTSVRIVFGVT